jgi:hypothetical protein
MRRLSLGELVKYIATWDRTIPHLGDHVSGTYPG